MERFTIEVTDETLHDLRTRLARTRWPDQVGQAGWNYGTELSYLRELVDYWLHTFDWKKREQILNGLPQFRATVDGLSIHFVHMRGEGSSPLPLIITHGWPSSFAEMRARDAMVRLTFILLQAIAQALRQWYCSVSVLLKKKGRLPGELLPGDEVSTTSR